MKGNLPQWWGPQREGAYCHEGPNWQVKEVREGLCEKVVFELRIGGDRRRGRILQAKTVETGLWAATERRGQTLFLSDLQGTIQGQSKSKEEYGTCFHVNRWFPWKLITKKGIATSIGKRVFSQHSSKPCCPSVPHPQLARDSCVILDTLLVNVCLFGKHCSVKCN